MNLSIIEVAFQALASNDSDRISAVFTEDAEWLSPPGNATVVALKLIERLASVHGDGPPAGGEAVGKSEVVVVFEMVRCRCVRRSASQCSAFPG